MAAPAGPLTRVVTHEVTLLVQVGAEQDSPEGWQWHRLLDLQPTEQVRLTAARQVGPEYWVDAEGRRVAE